MAGGSRYLPLQQCFRRQLESTGSKATVSVQSDDETRLQTMLLGTKQPPRASVAISSAAPTPVSPRSHLQPPRDSVNMFEAAELNDSQVAEGENSDAEKPSDASEPALACRMCLFSATTKRELAVHLLSDSHIALKKLVFTGDRKKPRSEAVLTSSAQSTTKSAKKVEAGAEVDDTVSLLLAGPSTSVLRSTGRKADSAPQVAFRPPSVFSPHRVQEHGCSLSGTEMRKRSAISAARTLPPVNLPEASSQQPKEVPRVEAASKLPDPDSKVALELSDAQNKAAVKPSSPEPETARGKQGADTGDAAAATDMAGAPMATTKSKTEQLADAWQQLQDLLEDFSDLLSPPTAGIQSAAPFARPLKKQAAAPRSTGLQASFPKLSINTSKPAAEDEPRPEGLPTPPRTETEASEMGLEENEGKAAADGAAPAESAARVSTNVSANTPRQPASSENQSSLSHSSGHWQYHPYRQPLWAHQLFWTQQHCPLTLMNSYQMASGGPWHLPNSVAALNTHAALLGMGFPPGPGFLLPGYGEFYGGIYNTYGEGFQNPYIPDPAAFLGAPFPAPSLCAPAFPQPPATQAKPSSSCKPVITKLKPNPVVDSPKKTKAAESGTVIDTSVPASEKRAKSKKKNKGPAGQAAKTLSVWVPVKSGGMEVLPAPKSVGSKPAPHNRRSKAVTPDKLPMAPSEWVGQSSVARETLPLKPAAAKQPSGIAIERPISFDGAPGTELVCPITLDFMQDPVVAQDGYTYEERAIRRWLQVKGTSPMTGQKMGNALIKNRFAIMLSMYQNKTAGTQS